MRREGRNKPARRLETFATPEEARRFIAEQEGLYFEGQHYIEVAGND